MVSTVGVGCSAARTGLFRVLASAVLSGERVFAVVGRNHVPMQTAALRSALED